MCKNGCNPVRALVQCSVLPLTVGLFPSGSFWARQRERKANAEQGAVSRRMAERERCVYFHLWKGSHLEQECLWHPLLLPSWSQFLAGRLQPHAVPRICCHLLGCSYSEPRAAAAGHKLSLKCCNSSSEVQFSWRLGIPLPAGWAECGWLRFCLCLLLSRFSGTMTHPDTPNVPFVTALSFLLCRSPAAPWPPVLLTLPRAQLPQGCHLYPHSCWPPLTTRALWALTRAMTLTRALSALTRALAAAKAPSLTLPQARTVPPSPPGTRAQCQVVPPKFCPCTIGRVGAPASSGSAWTGSMPVSTRASWWVAQLWPQQMCPWGGTEPTTELAHQTWQERGTGTWCHAECLGPGRNEMFENSFGEVSGLEIEIAVLSKGSR